MKRAISLLLAAALACGLTTTAIAASGKITGVNQAFTSKDYTDMSVSPGKVIEIPLTADIFEWSDGNGGAKEAVSTGQLTSGKVTLKITYDNNSKKIVENVEFKAKTSDTTGGDKTAHVRIEFVDSYASTKDLDFEFTVYLCVKSSRIKDSAVTFSGTFSNTVLIVDDDGEDYLDISNGEVLEAETYIKSIDLHLGGGLYINTKMYDGRQYYGVAEKGVTEDDYAVVDAYPEIDLIYSLNTVNLDSGQVYFEFDDEDEKYYVYNADGKYIGTTNDDDLKYSSKYYLSSKKINLSSSSKDEDDEDDYDEVIPVEEEDDVYEYYNNNSSGNSVNDNPETGVDDFLRVAVAMAILSGSILAACALKRRK